MFRKAGLFSAVSSAFVIDVQSKLQPDPNEQSAALLRAILLTLNQSAIPGENPSAPPIQEDPPHDIITVTGLMYASLLISLLAAFVAMLGKQWLNRYLRHAGGSMIERCGDRQRKYEGLERWPFHLFVESLPLMLQASLLLLACGLCQYMWSINVSVAIIIITLTVLGVLFYTGIVIAGTSSYECPFQTPASTTLRGLWKRIHPQATLLAQPIIAIGAHVFQTLSSNILHPLWKRLVCPVISTILYLKQAIVQVALNFGWWIPVIFRSQRHSRSPLSPIPFVGIQASPSASPPPSFQSLSINPSSLSRNPSPLPRNHSLHGATSSTHDTSSSHHSPTPSHHSPIPSHHGPTPSHRMFGPYFQPTPPTTPGNTGSWLTPEDLTAFQKRNTTDIRCVSWILRNITDPEALDAAIRIAGTVQWFEDGIDVKPLYDTIVSIFCACLDSTGAVYPGLLDRAYYSARAIVWVQIRAMSKPEEVAHGFLLPSSGNAISDDSDLCSILCISKIIQSPHISIYNMIVFTEHNTPSHVQWASRALLDFWWTIQDDELAFSVFRLREIWHFPWNTAPLDAALNLSLVWSIILGSPVEEGALKVQDKTCVIFNLSLQLGHLCHYFFSACVERVISHLSCAIITAVPASHPRHQYLRELLLKLARWDTRPNSLRAEAYKWCSAICKEYTSLGDGKELLFLSLEISSRGLDPSFHWNGARQVHHKHYQCMLDIVFKSGSDEVIADLLQTWIIHDFFHRSHPLSDLWARHLIHLEPVASTSQRLQQLIIDSIGYVGFHPFEQAGVEGFVLLLNHLGVGVDNMPVRDSQHKWLSVLCGVVHSPRGRQSLGNPCWELIPELATTHPLFSLWEPSDNDLQIMIALEQEQEWGRLGFWLGYIWLLLRPKINAVPDDLRRVTLSLLHHQPSIAEKLKQWLQRLVTGDIPECLECLEWICEQASLEAALQHDTP